MTKRSGIIVAIVGSALLWALILYVAGRYLPFDTTGEGYRGNE